MLIDPNGLFYGERIGACSDEAQLHFPRLMAAANGYGRVEMSVAKLHATVYASFKKKPTREQLQKWFREYHANFLLFVYRSGAGEVWGQWSVLRGKLPKWKTQEDNKSPAPPEKDFEAYLATYIEVKRAKITSSVDHISILEDFERLPKASEDFKSISHGEVEVEVVGEVEVFASTTPTPVPSRGKSKLPLAPHPLHANCRKTIADTFGDLPWDGSEAKALDSLLAAMPALTQERFTAMVRNRSQSDVNLSERPRRWIASLADYERGPLDAYSKPKALRLRVEGVPASPKPPTASATAEMLGREEREKRAIINDWRDRRTRNDASYAMDAPGWVKDILEGEFEERAVA